MSWDLETAKKYLEITESTYDEQIQLALDIVYANVERVLQRPLFFARETIRVLNLNYRGLIVFPRYPVEEVHSIDPQSTGNTCEIHFRSGWMQDPSLALLDVTVDYSGGYKILPGDLERAMWEAFMLHWSRTNPDTGGPDQTSVLGSAGGTGAVKDLTVFDAFKVSYDVGASGGDSGAENAAESYGWLAPWAAVWNMYRTGPAGAGAGIA